MRAEQIQLSATRNILGKKTQWKDLEVRLKQIFLNRNTYVNVLYLDSSYCLLNLSLRNVQNIPDFLSFPSFYFLLQVSSKRLHIFMPTFSYIHIYKKSKHIYGQSIKDTPHSNIMTIHTNS